jgi:hypothetical protein
MRNISRAYLQLISNSKYPSTGHGWDRVTSRLVLPHPEHPSRPIEVHHKSGEDDKPLELRGDRAFLGHLFVFLSKESGNTKFGRVQTHEVRATHGASLAPLHVLLQNTGHIHCPEPLTKISLRSNEQSRPSLDVKPSHELHSGM